MARAGQVIEHPVTGERAVFLKTAADTGGELLQMDFFMRPGGFISAEHIHPKQDESFEVIGGSARFRVGGKERSVGPGNRVVVPMGTPHIWWNGGDTELHVVIEFRPAGRIEEFFENFFGLAKAGTVNKRGLPNNLFQLAVLFREYDDALYPTRPPLIVQRLVLSPIALLGKLLGYRARHPEYEEGAKATAA